MELRYPIILIFGVIFLIIFIIFFKKNKKLYTTGKKLANTSYIKETEYYKQIIKKYKIILKTIKILCIILIITSLVLISRLAKTEQGNSNEYNRDIFLCMDVSASVDELNYELVQNLKSTVNSLKGERFGISIFNTTSVTLVPLTDDYEYVLSVLDQIGKAFETSNNYDYDYDYDNYEENSDYFYITNYIVSGTIEDSGARGSSLIGDGLASCVYNFSNLEEKRTRIIIFSTDNDLQGNPIVTLDEAAKISKEKNIFTYGIGTTSIIEENREEFKKAVESTGGAYYDQGVSSVNNIVSNIESTSKSLLKKENQVSKTDIPQIPFIILLIASSALIILNKKVMS